MIMAERDSIPVRIPNDARRKISHLKLRLSSEVMEDMTIGATIDLLAELGAQEFSKLTALAKKRYKTT